MGFTVFMVSQIVAMPYLLLSLNSINILHYQCDTSPKQASSAVFLKFVCAQKVWKQCEQKLIEPSGYTWYGGVTHEQSNSVNFKLEGCNFGMC